MVTYENVAARAQLLCLQHSDDHDVHSPNTLG
jgi:hypothetical protein